MQGLPESVAEPSTGRALKERQKQLPLYVWVAGAPDFPKQGAPTATILLWAFTETELWLLQETRGSAGS